MVSENRTPETATWALLMKSCLAASLPNKPPRFHRASSQDFHAMLLVRYQQPRITGHLKKDSKKKEIKAKRIKKSERNKGHERDKRKIIKMIY